MPPISSQLTIYTDTYCKACADPGSRCIKYNAARQLRCFSKSTRVSFFMGAHCYKSSKRLTNQLVGLYFSADLLEVSCKSRANEWGIQTELKFLTKMTALQSPDAPLCFACLAAAMGIVLLTQNDLHEYLQRAAFSCTPYPIRIHALPTPIKQCLSYLGHGYS